MKRRGITAVVSVALLTLVASLAYGQSPSSEQAAPPPTVGQAASSTMTKPASDGDKWDFRLTPYMWAIEVNSKVTIGGYTADVNTYFPDIWRNLDGALLLNFEGQKGKWGFFIDPIYMKLRGDGDLTLVRSGNPSPPTRDLTLTLELSLVEFGGFYQLLKCPLDWKQGKGRNITLDVLAGGRFWYLHADLDTTSPINPTRYNNWVDPIVGVRSKMDLTDKLSLSVEGDVGGFGVGSDFTWNAQGSFGYQFTPGFSAFVGYRALYVDYKAGTSRARYEETIQGPTGGITFKF